MCSTISYKFVKDSGLNLSGRQIDALNKIEDNIRLFASSKKVVPTQLFKLKFTLLSAFEKYDWSKSIFFLMPAPGLVGVRSNELSIYTRSGALVGKCGLSDIEKVWSGDLSCCEPVYNWNSTFSIGLKKMFGLAD